MAEHKTFSVEGMHCASCVSYLEETLPGVAGVEQAKVDLKHNTVTVSGDLALDPQALATKLSSAVEGNGYRLTVESLKPKANYREFIIAAPAAAAAILGFLLLQELGVISVSTAGSQMTLGTALVIGLIASVSTCLAVVGGLVLSLSANAAKAGARWTSQTLFHVGRLGGFFILGGVIGSAGKLFQLGVVGSATLSITVAVVMLILGLNLLDTFPSLKGWQLKMPRRFARKAKDASASSHPLAPFLVGIGTFFLPCGFTQSMQVTTLTSGSFLAGGLTMLAFALGTLPVLALLSFGAIEISHKPWKGIFFKAAGIVVIVLALSNVWNALNVLNII